MSLSITTVIDGPFDDKSDVKGFLTNRYRDKDPNHCDNVGLREVVRQRNHSAFDHNIIGLNPDFEVLARQDILEKIDGPMLK